MNQVLSPVTLGTHVQSIDAGSFRITETRHQPMRRLSRHCHEQANITLVMDGSFVEAYNQQSVECVGGSILVKPPAEAHSNVYGTFGVVCLVIETDPQILSFRYELLNPLGKITHLVSRTRHEVFRRIIKEFRVLDSASPLALEGLLLELLADISRHLAPTHECRIPRWLEQARELVDSQFAEELSLVQIAKAVDRHPMHLAREFRRHYRSSPGEYLRQRRVEFASEALARSDEPLVEIGLAAGFSHQSHFSRVFKQVTGLTPSEYRRRFQKR